MEVVDAVDPDDVVDLPGWAHAISRARLGARAAERRFSLGRRVDSRVRLFRRLIDRAGAPALTTTCSI
jgi:hypothetical protein